MSYLYENTKKPKKQRFFTKKQLDGLNPDERLYAQEQFRQLYAEEMSKLVTQMTHKKKIQQNVRVIDEEEEKNTKEQYEHLKNKMASIEDKRNKKMEERIKQYKQNDERWFNKLKQIQNKFKQKNKQAIEKARQYRDQSEKFWKSKEKKAHQQIKNSTLSAVKQNKINTIPDFNRSVHDQYNKKRYFHYQPETGQRKKTLKDESRKQKSLTRHEIDEEVHLHKQKSQTIQKEKEDFIFQKAMQKMERIEKRRKEKAKKLQSKVSEPTKPRVISNSFQTSQKSQKRFQSPSQHLNEAGHLQSKQSLEKLMKDHIEAKNRIEERQFIQRGHIFEQSLQRNRKDKIKKMLKNKIHEMKINVLKKQLSSNDLNYQ